MNNRRGEEFYGFGIIQNTSDPGLDDRERMMNEMGGDKQPIYISGKTKVNKDMGKNYYKDYLDEKVSDLNFEERRELNFDEAVEFMEPQANEDLDFDGDGDGDMEYGSGILQGAVADKAEEAAEDIQQGEIQMEAKPVNVAHQEKPIMESERVLQGQQKQQTMEGNKDIKLKNSDTTKDSTIKMSDGLIMGAGGLALALMIMGRNM